MPFTRPNRENSLGEWKDTTPPLDLTHGPGAGSWRSAMSIAQWQAGEAPRDKLLERGEQALSDAELLAVMLRTGYRNCSALQLARDLLDQFGGLAGLVRVDGPRLLAWPGVRWLMDRVGTYQVSCFRNSSMHSSSRM